MSNDKGESDTRRGLVIGGLIVLGLGIFFLCAEMGWLSFISYNTWPVILIIVGIGLLIGAFVKPRAHQDNPPQ